MARPLFTPEELEELRRFDEEVEEDFVMTPEEREAGEQLERQNKIDRSYGAEKTTRVYLEKNRERIRVRSKAYYEAHKEHLRAVARENARKNKKRNADRQRRYIAENRKLISERRRKYCERNKTLYAAKGRLLRKYRIEAGVSQYALGKVVGVAPSTVSAWENGRFTMNLQLVKAKLPKLSEALQQERADDPGVLEEITNNPGVLKEIRVIRDYRKPRSRIRSKEFYASMEQRKITRKKQGRRLKEYRKKAGMSQRELAAVLDVNQKTISEWELAEYQINMERIRERLPELAAALEEEANVDKEKDVR